MPVTLALAKAAHSQWIAGPDDARAAKNCYRCVARLVGWFDSLPLARRAEACRERDLRSIWTRWKKRTCAASSSRPGCPRIDLGAAIPVPASACPSSHGIQTMVRVSGTGSGRHRELPRRPPQYLTAEPKASGPFRFLSPYRSETVTVEGRTFPLTASFTAPIAKVAGESGPLRRSGFRGMLNSSGVSRREKLYLMQPYDPDRIPLLMVHGLQSTPVSFANLVNDLFAGPLLHARYQIWLYHYPTGTPVLQNPAVLRRILKQTLREIDPRATDFATNQLVVLGHSMGGS